MAFFDAVRQSIAKIEAVDRDSDGEAVLDTAVRQIIDLCLTAADARTARILFRAIQAQSIREEVLRDHPLLVS